MISYGTFAQPGLDGHQVLQQHSLLVKTKERLWMSLLAWHCKNTSTLDKVTRRRLLMLIIEEANECSIMSVNYYAYTLGKLCIFQIHNIFGCNTIFAQICPFGSPFSCSVSIYIC